MKVYNKQYNQPLQNGLRHELQKIRLKRNFNEQTYIKEKAKKLNQYMRICNLSSCVVALSGGVDSAIVYGIIKYAQNMEDSPINTIIPVTLPALNNSGVTNQEETLIKVNELCCKFGDTPIIIKMDSINEEIRKEVDYKLNIKGKDWAKGQLVPYSRTSVLYYITSLLSQKDQSGIIVGTTNRDEGGYLGYVGKASDGMVDVQLISDIHKSEVYKVAHELGVPESIIKAIPTGDMYDHRIDEEVFGTPYDFVELYINYLNFSDDEKREFKESLSRFDIKQFLEFAENLENLHSYNSHKYLGLSPAVHLDLFDSSVKGGWINYKNIYEEWLKSNEYNQNNKHPLL